VLHVVVSVYVACFAAGVTLIVVSTLASRHLALPALRDFAMLFAASTLILVVDASKTYESAVGTDFGKGLHVLAIVLSVTGNFGMGWFLPSIALQVVRGRPAGAERVLLLVLAAAVACLGGLHEAAELLWPGSLAGRLVWNVDYFVLLGLHLLAGAILLARFSRIQHPRLRLIVRSFLIYLGVFSVLAMVQLVLQNLPTTPSFVRDHPLEELLYYLGFVIMALYFLARYFSEPTEGEAISIPDDFLQRFGISNRERDIIEMMGRGFSNNAIAEKLFISTTTVKNHVYHSYRKTGVGNKVQLLNLVNSLK
jgi:DNA-binding CsgD family transcriptional regulator